MFEKTLWFLTFASTGIGLLIISLINITNKTNKIVLIIIALLFFIGLSSHFKELEGNYNEYKTRKK